MAKFKIYLVTIIKMSHLFIICRHASRGISALVVFYLLTADFAVAQVTEAEKQLRTVTSDTIQGWKKGGVVTFSVAQTSLTNWASGGQNSLSLNGLFSGFANYKKGKTAWDNTLDLGYGLLKQGDEDFRKTDDKIEFVSKLGQEAFGKFYYSALMSFKTQFSPGYNYPDRTNIISDFFSPAYLMFAAGLDYKPDPYFSAFLAPLTGKFTFVMDENLSDAGAFGVSPGETSRSEIGGYLRVVYSRADFKAELLKNVTFTTKLDLFSNYSNNPQNIDVNWDVLLGMRVNKFLTVSLNTQLIYDDDIMVPFDRDDDGTIETGEGVTSLVQFKEILGVGFAMKF
jgi:hypothetical protein